MMFRPASGLLSILIIGAWSILLPAQAQAQGSASPFWAGVGLGGGSVESIVPAPAAGRGVVAASMEIGYRLRPEWGIGVELGAIGPLSGCEEWDCGSSPTHFAPNFSRLLAFGEFRPRDSGLRVRAGLGVSRFCYERHWDDAGWSPVDFVLALIDESYLYTADGGSGAWNCDASRHALGGSLSIGYDWRVDRNSPLYMGLRLTAEAADFSASPSIGIPKFRHRAVMLTLQMHVN
jgi:hypothetical protein